MARDSSPHTTRRASTPALRDVGAVSAALQLSPLPTFMVDADGALLACNDLFADEAGVPQTLVIGRAWWEAFASASAESARSAQQLVTASTQSRGNARFELVHGDGRPATLATTWHRVTEPGTHRLMWIFAVTSWQRGVRSDTSVDEPARATPGPADIARIAGDEISDALAPASDPADILRRIRAISAGLRRFARPAPSTAARAPLADSVRAAVERFATTERDVRVSNESRADLGHAPADVTHALALLLATAASHARAGAPLSLRTYDEPSVVCLEVRAESAGVAVEDVSAGASSYFASASGAWLDLAAARAAIRALGGTVRANADPAGNLVLAAALPTVDAAQRSGSRTGERRVPLASRSVLLVDDEAILVRALGRLLESAGARVRTATTAADANSAIREEVFDAIVVDVHLPDGDGLSVARTGADRDPRTSIVVVTGQSDPALERLALSMGARAVLEKPFEPARLVGLLRDLIASSA